MIGFQFQPGSDQKRLLEGLNKGRLGPMANEALRVISLRLPQVLGGSPIAPEDLLRPRIGGSTPPTLDNGSQISGSGPAPILTGAGATGSAGTVRFRNPGIHGSALGRLVAGALSPGRPVIEPGSQAPSAGPSEGSLRGPGTPSQGTLPGIDDPYADRRNVTGANRAGNTSPVLSAGPERGITTLLRRFGPGRPA
jgi:hypothetical protein